MSSQPSKLTQVFSHAVLVFVDNITFVTLHQQMKGKCELLFLLCLDPNKGDAGDGVVATSANAVKDNNLCGASHHNSSFEVISLESR